VGRDTGSHGDRRPVVRRGEASGGGRSDVGAVPRRTAPAAPRRHLHPRRRRGRTAADGQGPGRDRRTRRGGRRRRPDRR
jgi:hypothetical protein